MKRDLLSRYKLEKRLSKLESLLVERSVGRGGAPSKAYQIWDYLMNNGPKSVADLRAALPREVTNFINFYADNNLLNKDGDMVSANAGYAWDDVGVIPRTAQQELLNSIRDSGMPEVDDTAAEEPAPTPARPARAPRQRAVKQNLFSRKFDEVKAAVDAGQDVNQRNDKGQTPLLYATNAKAGDYGDIIAYLLQHGANLRDTFKDYDAFGLACKNYNISAMKAILANDTRNYIDNPSWGLGHAGGSNAYNTCPEDAELIEIAASKERGEFDAQKHSFYYIAFARKIISQDKYEQLMKMIVNNSSRYDNVDSDALKYEFKRGITNTLECIIDKYSILTPRLWGDTSGIDRATCVKLLNLYKEAAAGKIKFDGRITNFVKDCKALCKATNQSPSFLDDMLSPEFISGLSYSAKEELFQDACQHNKDDVIQKLAAAKVKLSAAVVINQIRYHSDKARQLVKFIDKKTLSKIEKWDLDYVIAANSEYLLQYFVDNGFASGLLYWLDGTRLSNTNGAQLCAKVLRDNGIDVPDRNTSDDERRRLSDMNKRNNLIQKIVKAIEDDEWNRELEKAVTDNPEILRVDKISDAIDDNDTFTSRQLKRRLDNLPKDAYDM